MTIVNRTCYTGSFGALAFLTALALGAPGCGEGLVGDPGALEGPDGGVRETESFKCRASSAANCVTLYKGQGKGALLAACSTGVAFGGGQSSCDPYRVCRSFSTVNNSQLQFSPMSACFDAVSWVMRCDKIPLNNGMDGGYGRHPDTGIRYTFPDAGHCRNQSPCGPNSGYDSASKACFCPFGYLNCDGKWQNGCEVTGTTCPTSPTASVSSP